MIPAFFSTATFFLLKERTLDRVLAKTPSHCSILIQIWLTRKNKTMITMGMRLLYILLYKEKKNVA